MWIRTRVDVSVLYKGIDNEAVSKENAITKARYRRNLMIPNTIFTAPRLVILVEGPVSINAAALPMLIPSASHIWSSGMVPPPQAYNGTPTVPAISTPNASLPPNSTVIASAGTYL